MIFVDTNVISETLKPTPDVGVLDWLIEHDAELAIPVVAIAELAYGIARVDPEQRAKRLTRGLTSWRDRFAGRIFGFNEQAAMIYGDLMARSSRASRTMSAPDGMIAAIALVHGGCLATRNVKDFAGSGLDLINPWDISAIR